jgi:RNA polymerase sigma-70 factor (ECF subfamily)
MSSLERYFHFHGLRGALLRQAGRHAEARVSLQRAIALAHTPAEATHIRAVLDQLSQ